ncbi:hypothetical protein DPMN_004080 [Dreissena polymorpha]|uniref:Uncharacterized protein n=1 Tax=Dreissena polymorpha TaxID=45954 RepID=A0A9D4RVC8_DREPO|nr:hypothetical protein DPMN_004077 [Dreissena polymorpha]KAH3880168.1 hypothetical protein DPMN_004080 [Dreissena polymorpha]
MSLLLKDFSIVVSCVVWESRSTRRKSHMSGMATTNHCRERELNSGRLGVNVPTTALAAQPPN